MHSHKLGRDELAAIHAKSRGTKGVPSNKFIDELNRGIEQPDLKVTNVKMYVNSAKPHSEVFFKKGKVVKVKEHKDPETAVSHARMLIKNNC